MLAIGLLWLGLRILYWNGYYTEDAPGYVTDAIAIALRDYHARNHVNGLNIGTYAPVALPLLMFGKSEFALSLWPLLCSLLGVCSVGGIAAILFGRPFGVLAAFLYACYSFSRLSGTYSGDKHPGNQRPVNQPPLVTTR